MTNGENRIHPEEDNSFFENDYLKYTGKTDDSCMTGSYTLDDITQMYGFEDTRMLKDYETASIRMTDLTRNIQDQTDTKIEELTGTYAQDVRSVYEFDPDELTVGELIKVNEAFLRKQEELSQQPEEPYVSNVIAAFPGEATEQISVISGPEAAIASDESVFISVDDIL